MKSIVWPMLLLTVVAAACSSETAEPEIVTQRLATPTTLAVADTEDPESIAEAAEVADPACATVEMAMTGEALGDHLVAEGEEWVTHIVDAFAGFGDEVRTAIDRSFIAAAANDLESAAAAFDELDRLTLERCGWPGGAVMAMSSFVPLQPLCVESNVIGGEPSDEEREAYEACLNGQPYPEALPCFGALPMSWAEALAAGGDPPWTPVACDTGAPVEWSHDEDRWIGA